LTSVPDIAAASARVSAKTWAGFIAMGAGMFLAILDIQIVASSLEDIQIGANIPFDELSWVQTSYLMAEVVGIPLTGWLTRVMSTRGAFVFGMVGFILSSAACGLSSGFWSLIPARVVQGFCGGLLIPLVFSAVFLIFPPALRTRATVICGLLAMLAPTLGPTVGGFITDRYSWHWLFFINVFPGIIVILLVATTVTVDRPDWRSFGSVDLVTLPFVAVCLASLQFIVKEAPARGWGDPVMLSFMVLCGFGGITTIWRSLTHPRPLIDLSAFRERNFTLGCCFSFVLGIGLYGATYLLPVFLGGAQKQGAFDVGLIMMVTGATQLLVAPIAALLAKHVDARLLIGCGFALFAVGLVTNGSMTYDTDFWGLFWQQVARGAAIMPCILASTSLAMGDFPPVRIPNASGLFNLMRNLGGAIGLGVIDTVIFQRLPVHIDAIVEHLKAGDPQMAIFVGIDPERFHNTPMADVDEATKKALEPLVKNAGFVWSLNDAWIFAGGLVLLSLLLLPLLRRPSRSATGAPAASSR
jgi:DHA2 family multidrug resistance protein